MNRVFMRLLVVALAATVLWTSPSYADIYQLHADLDGLQETPPNGSPGLGSGEVALDTVTGMVTILSGDYFALIGTTTLAHIHQAPAGTPGGVIVTLTLDSVGTTTGTFSGGGGPLTPAQMTDMIAGNTYINIHSTVFPGGEIRGQLLVVPEPSSVVLLGCGTLAVVAAVWRRRQRPAA